MAPEFGKSTFLKKHRVHEEGPGQWSRHPGSGRAFTYPCGGAVAPGADQRIAPAVPRRIVHLCLHGRGARHSSRHTCDHDGAVRTARDPRALGHDAAFGKRHASGKHAGLAAISDADDQPDTAFRRFCTGGALSWRRFFHRLATARRDGCQSAASILPSPCTASAASFLAGERRARV
jgi:hypothetical protein